MYIVCSDLEGVFVPEIWIQVAEMTGVADLRLTTRDISDYDVLMKKRIEILSENKLRLKDIVEVIQTMDPLEGALDFLEWLRSRTQVIILSDTFVEFAGPLMKKLGWPTLFCNNLVVAADGSVTGYHLRQPDGKRKAVLSLRKLNYRIIAVGDSYNDITMIQEADEGILFCPPESVKKEYADLPVACGYDELKTQIRAKLDHDA